jgi:hypothetical protein
MIEDRRRRRARPARVIDGENGVIFSKGTASPPLVLSFSTGSGECARNVRMCWNTDGRIPQRIHEIVVPFAPFHEATVDARQPDGQLENWHVLPEIPRYFLRAGSDITVGISMFGAALPRALN